MKELDLGLHFIIGLSGTTLSERDKKVLEFVQPAGVMLLSRNFDSSLTYEGWINSLKVLQEDVRKYSKRKNLIISIDHEGGRVIRPPSPITKFPYACFQTKRLKEVTSAMALELRSLGVNVSFAPVADIHSNPQNPVIGERSFATTAEDVAAYATLCAQTLLCEGIIPCGKHFPGHGDTSTDSHFTLPVLTQTLDELRKRELIPFRALVQMNIPMIMSSHISFPNIDPDFPGTLSKKILTNLLREELMFSGVIISDDIDMEAVRPAFDKEETISRGISAGLDMLIVARHPDGNSERPISLMKNLKSYLDKTPEISSLLFFSEKRIRALIEQLSSYEPYCLPEETLRGHEGLSLACSSRI